MFVQKCDKCGKIVPDSQERFAVSAGIGYKRHHFCMKCGESIAKLLKQYKLDAYEEEK